MSKPKIITVVTSILVVAIGIYLFKFQEDTSDLVAGILIGIGCGSLVNLAILKGKSNFDKQNNS